jgi:hypothetical protein
MSHRDSKSSGWAIIVVVLLVLGLLCLAGGGLFLGFVWLALNDAHP